MEKRPTALQINVFKAFLEENYTRKVLGSTQQHADYSQVLSSVYHSRKEKINFKINCKHSNNLFFFQHVLHTARGHQTLSSVNLKYPSEYLQYTDSPCSYLCVFGRKDEYMHRSVLYMAHLPV